MPLSTVLTTRTQDAPTFLVLGHLLSDGMTAPIKNKEKTVGYVTDCCYIASSADKVWTEFKLIFTLQLEHQGKYKKLIPIVTIGSHNHRHLFNILMHFEVS